MLKDAIKARNLEEFILQAEAKGVPPADAAKFGRRLQWRLNHSD